ncbi:MAG: siderophore-interacting protein, partial [Rhodospirillales bacterium]|nr:siderophore-interacting protein [Acetobacter sp.]
GMAGPGGRGIRPAEWLLIAGDETALPAIARGLEALPSSTRGLVIVEVESSADALPLTRSNGIALRWLHRNGGKSRLAEAVMQVDLPVERDLFCWAGAEREQARAIRGYWRDTCGLDKSQHLSVAYWEAETGSGDD